MLIKARFSSTCDQCGQRIRVGDAIEYIRGQPASHAVCHTDAPARGQRAKDIRDVRKGIVKPARKA